MHGRGAASGGLGLGRRESRGLLEEWHRWWRSRNGLILAQAVAVLGLTTRTVSAYGTGARPVPGYIALACRGWEAEHPLNRRCHCIGKPPIVDKHSLENRIATNPNQCGGGPASVECVSANIFLIGWYPSGMMGFPRRSCQHLLVPACCHIPARGVRCDEVQRNDRQGRRWCLDRGVPGYSRLRQSGSHEGGGARQYREGHRTLPGGAGRAQGSP